MADVLLDRAQNDRRAKLTQYGVLTFGIVAVIAITVLTIANA